MIKMSRRKEKYRKAIKRLVRYKAHDEKSESKVGYRVRIEETRPLSKEKRWRVAEILAKGEAIEIKPAEIEPELKEVKPEEKTAEKQSG